MKRAVNLLTAVAALALAGAVGLAAPANAAGPERPTGWSDQSYYLPMRDGVRIAVSLYYPDHRPPTDKRTTILFQSRYGRAGHFARRLGDPERWRRKGYVVAVIDTRGSTSSFGPRDADIGPDEVRDMDELIAHFASRPWSNGKVVATGVSYMADTADWAASRPAPALVASIPRETDFDTYLHLFMPGGVTNQFMLQGWGGYTREIDLGRDGAGKGLDCLARASDCPKLFPVLQPVDEDPDYSLLRQALAGRKRWGPEDFENVKFRDEVTGNGVTLFASSPASALAGIRRERKPTQYWGSWVDGGTAEAALARYRSAPEVPMDVWITANDHSHTVGADPLRPEVRSPTPSASTQFEINRQFAEDVIAGKKVARAIHYQVMGTERFKTTSQWPPVDARPHRYWLTPDRNLSTAAPSRAGQIRYVVDFSATTGKTTRWSTQFGTPPAYADRREEDRKLLTFDGPAMAEDSEVVGTPVVTLKLRAATADPAIHAYVEDVAPDGRVTYLGEGMLRAIHRKIADPKTLPYDQGPAPHSFSVKDALAVKPGETLDLRFALFPFAARLQKGHRLRLAIAGGDADTFQRFSEGKAETFTVLTGPNASMLDVTVRPWRD